MKFLKEKLILFGKSNKDIRSIKQSFIDQNDQLLKKSELKGKIYRSQKKRNSCKACEKKLTGEQFISHSIKYILCKYCTHLNGNFEDSEKFANEIYLSKKMSYSANYNEENLNKYLKRVEKIYVPKAKFLKKNFTNFKKIKILDIGSGSGYFISALSNQGFKNIQGLEISEEQVRYGNKMLSKQNKKKFLLNMDFSKITSLVNTTNFNCISMIGVLEHITKMRYFLKNVKLNKNIKFIYLSVPLFSFTTVFESIFDKVNNRHLAGSHTHLFTEKSLKRLLKEYGFEAHSELQLKKRILD